MKRLCRALLFSLFACAVAQALCRRQPTHALIQEEEGIFKESHAQFLAESVQSYQKGIEESQSDGVVTEMSEPAPPVAPGSQNVHTTKDRGQKIHSPIGIPVKSSKQGSASSLVEHVTVHDDDDNDVTAPQEDNENTGQDNWVDDTPDTPPERPKTTLAGVDVRHFGQVCNGKFYTWPRPKGFKGQFVGSRFYNNQGPMIRNVYAQQEYTIILNFWLDWVDGWIKVIDYKNLQSDAGLYFHDGRMKFKDPTGKVISKAEIKAMQKDVFTQVALTRDSAGIVTAYLDGVSQLSFNDSITHWAIPDGDGGYGGTFFFFQDDVVTGDPIKQEELFDKFADDPMDKRIGDKTLEKNEKKWESAPGWLMGFRVYHIALAKRFVTKTNMQKFDPINPLPRIKGDDGDDNENEGDDIVNANFPKNTLCGTQISKFGYKTADGFYGQEDVPYPGGAEKITMSRFDRNRGLGVRNFVAVDAYSIVMNFKMDHVDGKRKIIDFGNRQDDYGLFNVGGKLLFNGTDTGPRWSDEPILKARVLTQMSLTRSDRGKVTIYVNGRAQLKFSDDGKHAIPGTGNKQETGYFYFFCDKLKHGELARSPKYPAAPQGLAASASEARPGGEGLGSDDLPGPDSSGGWEGRIRIYGSELVEEDIRELNLMAENDVDAVLNVDG